jgi:hypothetical protein
VPQSAQTSAPQNSSSCSASDWHTGQRCPPLITPAAQGERTAAGIVHVRVTVWVDVKTGALLVF